MTPEEQEIQDKHAADVSRERAKKDLEDIRTLRNTVAFDRYFMRRVGEKKKVMEKSFRHDTMPHEEREILRRSLRLIDEIEGMMTADESIINRIQ